ncbi:hypothetical protein CVT26_000891 [Gymnopilus dilepis]|uniref:AB hydrolase-1 domain-containing protein n=1 Tax=Gymnopilus dilepis TaxID=231916 RepID=A0A409WB89_9AGAR|nr:hypothetical protein CVT26_000891 [Gymnopilus dilepis]
MLYHLLACLVILFPLTSGYGPRPQSRCQQATISVHITAHPRVVSLAPPKNQSELTGLVTNFTSMHSNLTTDIVHGTRTLTATYDIWTLLCLPSTPNPDIVEFAIHGISLDHTYWNFGGEGSQYNYVDAATKAGHAIFIFDRLGAGESSKPDGIQDLQEETEVEVVAELIRYIRSGKTGHQFQQIIGIGHSYGRQVDLCFSLEITDAFLQSLLLTGIAARYGNLLNATILTGFTPYTTPLPTAFASFGLTIAAQENPQRFGNLSNAYLTITNEQFAFYYFPHFDPDVFRRASQNKDTAALGQIVALSAAVATNYTNPVLVVTGDRDFIYCGGDCYQPFAGFGDLVESSYVLFPSIYLFSWYIPTNMGHIINFHYGAPEVFKVIQLWISLLNPKVSGDG